MNRLGLTLAFVLLATGCRTRLPEGPILSPCEVSRGTLSMFGGSRAEMIAVLGAPVESEAVAQPNRHVPDAVDTIHTLEWEGLVVTVHEAPVVGRELLSGVIATKRGSVPVASWIGRSREELISVLGEPVTATGLRSATWECFNELAPETIEAEFEDGRVARVTIRYPID